jgi:hypothetical protein
VLLAFAPSGTKQIRNADSSRYIIGEIAVQGLDNDMRVKEAR